MKELASIDFQRHKWRISILTGPVSYTHLTLPTTERV